MAITWTQPSGFSFGTFEERIKFDQALPVSNDSGVTYTVISGKLPDGLRIHGNRIVGTPYEVARLTEFTFCIRAKQGSIFADRSFKIAIDGADSPIFVTPAGNIAIGEFQQFYTLDNTYIDFQIQVTDTDTAVGQHLSYFIARDEGELPPGLTLSEDGRLIGFVLPAISIKPEDGDGTYDNSYYDAVAYDFAFRPTNGYDSYVYDSVFFDFSLASGAPKKLNRNYEFIATVTDGDSIAKRKFRIFVVSDDYFRADNTTWLDGTSLFTADTTYMRAPTWKTASDLGLHRANNYLTLIVDTFDTENIIYDLALVNANIYATVTQKTSSDNIVGGVYITTTLTTVAPLVGYYFTFDGLVAGADSRLYQIYHVTSLGNNEYRLTVTSPLQLTIPNNIKIFAGTISQLPPGMQFDRNNAEIFGLVPYQPAITKTYNFTLTASRISNKGELTTSARIFTVRIIGEVDSIIAWQTPSDLGTINANFISTLNVTATSTVTDAVVLYQLTSGRLPPGLSLDLDGELVGKVNQYGNPSTGKQGLTTFDFVTEVTTFDTGTTTVDRVYDFTVQARDQYGYSASSKSFKITVATPNEKVFSNLKVKPFLKADQRAAWQDFINNTSVFTPSSIYRPNDNNFGIQTELSILVYAGIETTDAAAYVGAMGLNHKRKRFQFGSVKKATAVSTGTNSEVYEVIYVEMIDPLEPNGKRLPAKLTNIALQPQAISVDSSTSIWSRSISDLSVAAPFAERPDPILTVDSTGYAVSNPNSGNYFPNSVSNWRDRLLAIGDTERNYLPLWMRSIQPGTKAELGFTLALPLCFCKAGAADSIILNIKHSGFDFKSIDYTADRYIIDSVTGLTQDKYLVFRNDRITV